MMEESFTPPPATPAPAPASDARPADHFDWRAELKGLAAMLAIVLGFHSFVAKPFYIPSASMAPNLWVGDRLVVSKYAYGWNWSSPSFHILGHGDWRVMPRTPEYGDIVIVVPRGTDVDYIKRVVALPGDRIALKNGQIILNGHPVHQAMQPPADIPLDALASDEDPTPCEDGLLTRLPSGAMVCELPMMRETMPNGASYDIIGHMNQPQDHMHEIRVPAGHVFVMGDNRDHSADSRFSLEDKGLGGPVPISDIGGRAEFTTFSLDGTASRNPLSWAGALRKLRAWRNLRPPLDHGGTNQ